MKTFLAKERCLFRKAPTPVSPVSLPPLRDPGTRALPPVPCEITAQISPSQIAHMPDAAMTRPHGHQSALCDAEQLVVFAATTVAFRGLAAPFVIP